MLYLKDTQKWKQFTTIVCFGAYNILLCYISKILKNESNSQLQIITNENDKGCVISQRYSKMKAIHNIFVKQNDGAFVVLYLKDTQKWKQFTTMNLTPHCLQQLCYISKILKNESNSQLVDRLAETQKSCVISQRYSKMKAIHNHRLIKYSKLGVVLYLKDTQKWKQFTTSQVYKLILLKLCYISKILKNESNSQRLGMCIQSTLRCVISQRYSKMKAIHNTNSHYQKAHCVVLYLKDTQKWKQFTTCYIICFFCIQLCYISKILKNESNSQHILSRYT